MWTETQYKFIPHLQHYIREFQTCIDGREIIGQATVHLCAIHLHIKAADSPATKMQVFPLTGDSRRLANERHVSLYAVMLGQILRSILPTPFFVGYQGKKQITLERSHVFERGGRVHKCSHCCLHIGCSEPIELTVLA